MNILPTTNQADHGRWCKMNSGMEETDGQPHGQISGSYLRHWGDGAYGGSISQICQPTLFGWFCFLYSLGLDRVASSHAQYIRNI